MGTKSPKCNTENPFDSSYRQEWVIPLLSPEEFSISPSMTPEISKSAHQSLVRDRGI